MPAASAIPQWFEIGSFVVLIAVLIFDLLYVIKRPHIPSMKEAALWVSFYVALALGFFGLMWSLVGQGEALQFLAGWVTEYSLSVDNLFVFIIIMANFAVPRKYQQEVLMVGIIIALVLRGVFIMVGATVIENFTWVFYLFGAFLLITAVQQMRSAAAGGHGEESSLINKITSRLKLAPDFDGNKLRTTVDGKRMWTPMIAVFIALGLTDLMFAVDSIPAIFGITQSPFIVFTANIFALMGLRQLYFLLGGLMDRLVYLSHGIAIILGFIGLKLLFHALSHNELPFLNGGQHINVPEITTEFSLLVIVGTIVLAVVASLLSPKGRAVAAAHRNQSSTDQTADAESATKRASGGKESSKLSQ